MPKHPKNKSLVHILLRAMHTDTVRITTVQSLITDVVCKHI